jgi:anthranilate synthase component 2
MSPRILMLDNHDSFTWNVVQYLAELGASVDVVASDAVTVDAVAAARPDAVVISPGPCTPREAGVSVPLVRALAGAVPILGVCLGHQAIGVAFGARVRPARRVMHGKTSLVRHDGAGPYAGLPDPFPAMRYHSLALEPSSLPPSLRATAWSDDGELMGVRHATLPVEGVQFHPESILTPHGKRLLENFLAALPAGAAAAGAP